MITMPPLTGTPLDYVPIDAPVLSKKPVKYRPPALKRAALAGAWTAVIAIAFYISPPAFIAIAAMSGSVWVGGMLADRFNRHDDEADSAGA